MTSILAPKLDISATWEAFDAKARSEEARYESAARAQFRHEAAAVVSMIEANIPDSFKSAGDIETKETKPADITIAIIWPYIEAALLKVFAAYSSVGTFSRQWYNRFRPLIVQTMAQAEGPNVRIGMLGPTSPQVMSAIQRRVTKLAGNVTETTAQQIRDVVTQARVDGVGVGELAKRIRLDVFNDSITTSRATTIARTETVGALNEGAWIKANATPGLMRAKHWISQHDGKVRPSHKTADAQGWIPINQPFSNGLHYPHEPGAPADEVINCRCSFKVTDQTADEANGGSP